MLGRTCSLRFLHFYARLGAGEGLPGACDANPKMNTPTLAGVTITPPPSSPHCPILLGPWTAPGPTRWEHKVRRSPSMATAPPLCGHFPSSELKIFFTETIFLFHLEWTFYYSCWLTFSPHDLWASHPLCGPNTLVSRELVTAIDRKYRLSGGDW